MKDAQQITVMLEMLGFVFFSPSYVHQLSLILTTFIASISIPATVKLSE